MVMQSLDDAFDDGYGVFDEDGGEAEDPQEAWISLD